MTQTIDAIYVGGVLKPLTPLNGVVEHAQVRVTVDGAPDNCRSTFYPGSIATILEAVRQPPHVSKEDVEAMERAIEEGKLPLREEGIFDADR